MMSALKSSFTLTSIPTFLLRTHFSRVTSPFASPYSLSLNLDAILNPPTPFHQTHRSSRSTLCHHIPPNIPPYHLPYLLSPLLTLHQPPPPPQECPPPHRASQFQLTALAISRLSSYIYLAGSSHRLSNAVNICVETRRSQIGPGAGCYDKPYPQEEELRLQWQLYTVAWIVKSWIFTWNGMLLWLVTTAMTGHAKEARFKRGKRDE